MYVVDANVLLYAVNRDTPHHEEARTWLDGALAGVEDVYFTDLVELAFLRLATKAEIFARPLTISEACGTLELWRSAPAAVGATGDLRRTCDLLSATGTAGNLVNDAYLASLAAERGFRIVTFDRDFERFPGVDVHLLGGGPGATAGQPKRQATPTQGETTRHDPLRTISSEEPA